MQKIWRTKERKSFQDFSEEIRNIAGSELLANLLFQRGLDTPKKIDEFLNPSKMKISSPYVFTDMEKSVKRIFEAIDKQEKIVIYGDFDCDGVTATALLYKTLSHLNANVDYYIPNREAENHGLNTKALVKLIAKNKAKLIITVDCGVSDVEQVKFANGFNVDVIITDHHEAPDDLPDAFSIINPKAYNSLDKELNLETISALNQLAGVGVAFKLACALLEKVEDYDFVNNLLPLVTVGTIADIVPVLYENRSFIDAGLKLIEQGQNRGLKVLLEKSGFNFQNKLTSEIVAFNIAPRINAAGRLDTVDNAFKLLVSDSLSEIEFCCEELNNFNRIRQDFCENIYAEAIELIKNGANESAIVLYNPDWHIGIIGIVASKLVERFYKPVFLMTKDKNTGLIRCSCRSIPEVHIRDVIAENGELMEHFGGHSQAAGLVFDSNKNSFEKVKAALVKSIDIQIEGKELLPVVNIDFELGTKDLNLSLIDEISKLEPFGEGNKAPLFSMKNLILNSYRTMGANNNHLKIFCEDKDSKPFECVYWNKSELNVIEGKTLDVAFYPKINVFNGVTSIQLDLQDVKSEFLVKSEINSSKKEFKFYDHRKKIDIYSQINDYLITTKVSTKVFVSNKDLCSKLEKYPLIFEKIINRKNCENCSQLMFFDYPANENILSELVRNSGAKILHFMDYSNSKIDSEEIVKKISGMLKFASNNRDGEVDIIAISDHLAVSDEVVELCLDIFESTDMIEIYDRNQNNYKIKFVKSLEFSKIKEHDMYEELENELLKIFEYRDMLMKITLSDIDIF